MPGRFVGTRLLTMQAESWPCWVIRPTVTTPFIVMRHHRISTLPCVRRFSTWTTVSCLSIGTTRSGNRRSIFNLPFNFPAGALLAFTVSFDNFLITYMLSGPGMTTIPVQIYSMVRFEITPKIHAFSTVIILFSMTLIIINERLIRAKRD